MNEKMKKGNNERMKKGKNETMKEGRMNGNKNCPPLTLDISDGQ